MKTSFYSICLAVLATATVCAADLGRGLPIEDELPVRLSLCPAYDDPEHIVMLAYHQDCSKYYTCLNGLAYAHQCPDNLYWSSITYRCDYKQYSDCEQTTRVPDSQPYGLIYQAYPGDCSRFYETRIQQCPDNLYYNPNNQRCVPPQLSQCRDASSYTSAFVPTAATPPTDIQPGPQDGATNERLPIDPKLICLNSGQQWTYVPYPGDCHKFIYCGQTADVLRCPTGLYWNAKTQSCSRSNVGCI